MSVYSISYGIQLPAEVKATFEKVFKGSKAIQLNEECWFLETPLPKKEVIETLAYIAEFDKPICFVTRLYFGDWLGKAYSPEIITWLTNPRRNWS